MKLAFGLFMLVALLVPSPLIAQFDTGAVLASVRDSTGAVLPGVTVTLRNVATGVTSVKTTDERGAYEFFTVRAGDITVTAELTEGKPDALGERGRPVSGEKTDDGAIDGHPPPKRHHFSPVTGRPRSIVRRAACGVHDFSVHSTPPMIRFCKA